MSHDGGKRTARVNRERKSDGQPGASFVPVRSLNGSSMNAHKSFQKKGGGESGPEAGRDFHGEKRSNETHESKTDPESRLYKKSYRQEAKLAYLGHTVVENRNGLIAAAMATQADGTAERDAAILMVAGLRENK